MGRAGTGDSAQEASDKRTADLEHARDLLMAQAKELTAAMDTVPETVRSILQRQRDDLLAQRRGLHRADELGTDCPR